AKDPKRGPEGGQPSQGGKAASAEAKVTKQERREMIAERVKQAEKTKTNEIKATRKAEIKSEVKRLERQIAKDRSEQLRIQNEIEALKKRRISGPEKEAARERLAEQAKKYDERIGDAQAKIAGLSEDPLAKLRAYSYSAEAERTVISRAGGPV